MARATINNEVTDPVPVLVVSADGTVTYTEATGTFTASGDNTIIAAPSAGNHLEIGELVIQNESATDTTVILKSGSTAKRRAKLTANAAYTASYDVGQEWALGSAAALVANLSAGNSHGYYVRYRTVAD